MEDLVRLRRGGAVGSFGHDFRLDAWRVLSRNLVLQRRGNEDVAIGLQHVGVGVVVLGQDVANDLALPCRSLMLSPFYKALFSTRLSEDRQAVEEFKTTAGGARTAKFRIVR